MLFTSIVFLLYFLPIVLFTYYLCSFSRKLQNIILFLASLIFYAWGEVKFVWIMLGSILINTLLGYFVDKYKDKKSLSKGLMILACGINLGILFIFKYFMFTVRNINSLFHTDIVVTNILLPLGISFYTFQAISYVVDVYTGKAKVEKNPLYVGLYIAFFPQLIAGPIVKYDTIAEQIHTRKSSMNKFSLGVCRFMTGFCKKILLANNFAIIADHVFDLSKGMNVSVSLAWLGAIAYTLQIFFDFSAYSDMAIGLAAMFGFRLEENFNYPYISKSIGEFWRRWHISLSSFFREYVYFPLGGSRVENEDKVARNLLVVWFLTGVWHGAEWTFILWGLVNFIFILGEKLFKFEKWKGPVFLKRLYTLFVIIISWVLFRAENLNYAFIYFENMFGVGQGGFYSDMTGMFIKEFLPFWIAGIILCTPIGKKVNKLNVDGNMPIIGGIISILYPAVMMTLFIICVSYLVIGSYNPFIYFNF